MKTFTFLLILILAAVLFAFIAKRTDVSISDCADRTNALSVDNKLENEEEGSMGSYEFGKNFFSVWNHPYSNGIPSDVQLNIWRKIQALPSEEEIDGDIINSWQMIGPFGEAYPDSLSIKYSGRVTDIEPPRGNVELRVAAASGGIWRHLGFFGVCVSNSLPTPWIGSIATDPTNSNIIYAGTGEPAVMGGIGLWKTTDGGTIWQQVNFAGYVPWCFYKIRFDPNISGRVHAASSDGYFRSEDGGNTWVRKYAGLVSDFAINVFNNSSVVYIAVKDAGVNGGIFKSTNGGDNFSTLTNLPTADIGKSMIATGNSPNIVYVFMGRNSTQLPMGVYRSDNSGGNWTNITPQSMQAYSATSMEYHSMLTVCPADPYTLMIGTISMCRSTNGGQNWTEYWDFPAAYHPYRNLHGDHRRMEWKDGNTVYSGNDGGIAVSQDRGATWSTAINILPVTQIYNFDVGISNKNVIFGGTQDNGIVKTADLGHSSWLFLFTGDGGGIEIDPVLSNKVYSSHGGSGVSNVSWGRYKTIDGGLNWSEITNNLPAHNDWSPLIHSDKSPPVYLYTNAGSHMFKSTNEGVSWTQMNTTAFPTSYILNFSVSKYVSGGSVIYACLEDIPESGNHSGKLLRVYDNGTWYERSSGLPQSGAWVRNVAIHPTDVNTAYTLMNGFSGQKIFKTTNKGVSWTNITGDLPNIPVSDLIPHPTDNNKLYLGSEYGCYKTSNGGVNWYRWNNGMADKLPQSSIINDLSVIDSIAQNGKYYILAGTYGRGIWMREISGDDPIGIINNSTPVAYRLSQNYPNPFNPATNIDYSIAKSGTVRIVIYDVIGRVVRVILDEKETPGNYSIKFDGKNLSSGIYFYRLETESFIDVKKMILVK